MVARHAFDMPSTCDENIQLKALLLECSTEEEKKKEQNKDFQKIKSLNIVNAKDN